MVKMTKDTTYASGTASYKLCLPLDTFYLLCIFLITFSVVQHPPNIDCYNIMTWEGPRKKSQGSRDNLGTGWGWVVKAVPWPLDCLE